MAKVAIMVPFFDKPPELQFKFLEWLDKPETKAKLHKLGLSRDDIDPKPGYVGDILDDQGLHFYKTIKKGLFIQRMISSLKASPNPPDFYVCIDGEGINFDYALTVVEQLKNTGVLGVMACRKNNFQLGNPEREIAERFELFIPSKIFGTQLIDGQCGCWGFRKTFLNRKFEAEGFEIELDFLINLLQLGREVSYIPVEILRDPTDISSFKLPDHKDKIEFISRKLGRTKEEIQGLMVAFEKDNEILSEEYKKMVERLKQEPTPIRFTCTGTCVDCVYK